MLTALMLCMSESVFPLYVCKMYMSEVLSVCKKQCILMISVVSQYYMCCMLTASFMSNNNKIEVLIVLEDEIKNVLYFKVYPHIHRMI